MTDGHGNRPPAITADSVANHIRPSGRDSSHFLHSPKLSPSAGQTSPNGDITKQVRESSQTDLTGLKIYPEREPSPLPAHPTTSARGTSASRLMSPEPSPGLSIPEIQSPNIQQTANAHPSPTINDAHAPTQTSTPSNPDGQEPRTLSAIPRWPVSPRFTSPPPSATRNSSLPRRKADTDAAAPNISQKRSSASIPDLAVAVNSLAEGKDDNLTPRAGMKTPSRVSGGIPPALETVSENGTPDTSATISPLQRSNMSSQKTLSDSLPTEEVPESSVVQSARGSGDSESDGLGITTIAESPPATARLHNGKPSNLAKKSFSNLAATKGRASELLNYSMTVETETVPSCPQAPIHLSGERGASGKLDVNSSIRTKPSTETMKPKKEKRRVSRRPASINTGTGR